MDAMLTSTMKNILEQWINGPDKIRLDSKWITLPRHAIIFGIRRYLGGASLHLHTDRSTPNVIKRQLIKAGEVDFYLHSHNAEFEKKVSLSFYYLITITEGTYIE